jgi:5'-nucleotidase
MPIPALTLQLPPVERRLFCNRTLNLRSIQAVGFDMDYTLVHYDVELWENRAFEHARSRLQDLDWPVSGLSFQRSLTSLGLIMDAELGNLVKVNRFGHVRKACHGTTMLSFGQVRDVYGTSPLELSGPRFLFLDTLFSLSESCLYLQLVDLLDANRLKPGVSYQNLVVTVREALDAAHLEGDLKADIVTNPERYVVLDDELVQTLLDLEQAGKRLVLITNSEWEFTRAMMHYAIDRYLPARRSFRDLFSLIIVQARKPTFFAGDSPAFHLVDDSGLLRAHVGKLELGNVYVGANARLVERSLDLRGDDILYMGDHIFADVHASKDLLRWRTALIVRELEIELRQLVEFAEEQRKLDQLMQRKMLWEHEYSQLRLRLQRMRAEQPKRHGPSHEELRSRQDALRQSLLDLDDRIAPLAERSSQLVNERWGQLMRTGTDKSYLARQIEHYADIYMSRVSNLLAYTPFVYLRAPRGTLPHDAEMAATNVGVERTISGGWDV